MEKEIDIYNQNRAKEFIDGLFDAKIFKEDITRNDMQGFEDLLAFVFQASYDSSRKMAEFSAKWNLKK